MCTRLFRHAGTGIGNLQHNDAALAAPGDADLVARRIARPE
jgi:hypothetical protein